MSGRHQDRACYGKRQNGKSNLTNGSETTTAIIQAGCCASLRIRRPLKKAMKRFWPGQDRAAEASVCRIPEMKPLASWNPGCRFTGIWTTAGLSAERNRNAVQRDMTRNRLSRWKQHRSNHSGSDAEQSDQGNGQTGKEGEICITTRFPESGYQLWEWATCVCRK